MKAENVLQPHEQRSQMLVVKNFLQCLTSPGTELDINYGIINAI